jgi:hypothetical protein
MKLLNSHMKIIFGDGGELFPSESSLVHNSSFMICDIFGIIIDGSRDEPFKKSDPPPPSLQDRPRLAIPGKK